MAGSIPQKEAAEWLLLACIQQIEGGSLFLSEFVSRAPGQAGIDWLLSEDLGLSDRR